LRATLHDALMREAGYEAPADEAHERRHLLMRRQLGGWRTFFGVAVVGAIAAGLELLDHGGRVPAGGVLGVVLAVGALLASRRRASRR
jgi:hypothetical protein